jgi:hypothetical protein
MANMADVANLAETHSTARHRRFPRINWLALAMIMPSVSRCC